MLVVESEPAGASGPTPPGARDDPSAVFPVPEVQQADRWEPRVSRNMVRKVIRSGGTGLAYERTAQP